MAAYKEMHKESLWGRELEASVLTRIALMLKGCQDNWGAPGNEERLGDALRFHQKVWSIFQVELANPENPLPKEIRENILNLSLFMDKRVFEVMANPSPEKLTIIININLNLATGLNSKPEETAA
jgi:flagellar protein FlaF